MNDENRPSPDAVLHRINLESRRTSRGRLKIFFGMAPGVGKTYAMLSEAQLLKQEGVNVQIGWIETHGRPETLRLTEGLARIPPKEVEYRGIHLQEMDIDAILATRPGIVLIDELAHTNAPGSRHKLRYLDVQELLKAGINVFTTVNVQHLESLNDVVAGITGVTVRERVPDSIFDHADEVELVDLSIQDLLKRLKSGQVYIPQQAQLAVDRFFSNENLSALRELALRKTAERVHEQADIWRGEQGITRDWTTMDKLMVAVGPAPQSANLIRAAYRTASRLQVPWITATVENTKTDSMSQEDRVRIRSHLALADRLGAQVLLLRGDDVSAQILKAARDHGVTRLLVGKPAPASLRDRLRRSPVDKLIRDPAGIDILVTNGRTADDAKRPAVEPKKIPFLEYVWSLITVLLATGICFGLREHFTTGDHAMVYILAILFASMRLSRGPATLTAFLSVAAVDFFFVAPFMTLAVADIRSVVTFLVLLAVGLTVSNLTFKVRREAESARERERRTASMYSLSRQLAAERKLDNICQLVGSHLLDVLKAQAVFWIASSESDLVPRNNTQDWMKQDIESATAAWVFQHQESAGHATTTLPGSSGYYTSLMAGDRCVGVIGINGDAWDSFTLSQRELFEVFLSLAAQAIERTQLARESHQNQLKAEMEQTRNDLLSTLSHDLRTPLSSLTGAATLLADVDSRLSPESRHEMLASIKTEAERLARLIADVTDLTRLESGVFKLKKDWCPVDELISSAVLRMKPVLGEREIRVNQPREITAVPVDAVLIEQVIVNLLDNAAKYTPSGSALDIDVDAAPSAVVISVSDRGPGIPAGEEEHIFEKYHRVMGDRAAPGMGIGLALCRTIVNLHGGTIQATGRDGGGAVFTIRIPVDSPPPVLKDLSDDA